MPHTDMTTWVHKPDGTRYALGLTEDGEVVVLMTRPNKSIHGHNKVIGFKPCAKPNDLLSEIIRYENLPRELGLKLTKKGQATLGK